MTAIHYLLAAFSALTWALIAAGVAWLFGWSIWFSAGATFCVVMIGAMFALECAIIFYDGSIP
ncbi:hypothetical protein ACFLZW_07870 [Chloroflexota bacterium]